MGARHIRLKEYDPSNSMGVTPKQRFIERSDHTLETGPFMLRTDHNSFIRKGNDVADDATPLAVLGGSFVESSYVQESQRFVSQAERLLSGYKLLNGGYSGATTLHLYNNLLNKVYPIVGPGGTVVFFVGQSDADILHLEGSYWTDERLWSPIVPAATPQPHLPTGIEQVKRMIRLVITTGWTLGINLVLASSPYRQATLQDDPVLYAKFNGNQQTYDQKMQEQADIHEATLEVGAAHGVDVIDFQLLTEGDPAWFYDALHLNAYGQTRFAELFVEELTKRL